MSQPIVVNIFVGTLSEVASVPLTTWAERMNRPISTLRDQANKGKLPGAHKRGDEWYIDPIQNAIGGVVIDSPKGGTKGKRRRDVRDDRRADTPCSDGQREADSWASLQE